jgi:hypothetical protein
MEERGGSFWWEDLMKGDHLEDRSLDGRIILNWIYKKCDSVLWTGLIWLRIETVAVPNLLVS